MTDVVMGLYGKESSGPRWAAMRERNNAGARLLAAGRAVEAVAILEDAYRMTLVDDLDSAGYDCRARALANLSTAAEMRGDTGEALRLAEAALTACDNAEREAGNRYSTAATRTSIHIQRAQTYQLLGRYDKALLDLDRALALTENADQSSDDDRLVEYTLHNTRTVQLIYLERFEEADAAARRTLELANARDPRLAAHPYSNLALIAQAHNEHDAAMTYLRLAEQIHTTAGDTTAAALAVANQGRAASRYGDSEEASRLLATAEQAFLDGEQPLRAAEIRLSRAHAAFQNEDADLARSLLPQAIETFRSAGSVVILAEALSLQGDMLAAESDLYAAENAYLEARALYQETGARYHLARVDMRRALAISDMAERATDPQEQVDLIQKSLYLSLPSALATDAIRHTYAPGKAREQWAATVAIPAMAHALHMAMALQDGALISELLEHMSGTMSLYAPNPAAAFPAEIDALEPSMFSAATEELSFAASAFVTGVSADFPTPEFALPPRIRVNPNRASALEPWIAAAEEWYGFAIRSDLVIDAW